MTIKETVMELKYLAEMINKGPKVYLSEDDKEQELKALNGAIKLLVMPFKIPYLVTNEVNGWIPFKIRPVTEDEKYYHPDLDGVFDCELPEDGQDILISNGETVWKDTFIHDGMECYLDGGEDIEEGMAWMPLPQPHMRVPHERR